MAVNGEIRNLDDLAEKAGVTAATVSMALRNSPRLSEEVRGRICALARESGFTPRSYRRRATVRKPEADFGRYGPLLVLHYELPGEPDPVRDGVIPPLLLLLNERKIEYRYLTTREVMENPKLTNDFRGLVYYNDPSDFTLPAGIPTVQIFGWQPMREGQDRITANDEQIVRLVANYFRRIAVKRAAIVWCREMLPANGEHPRISGFLRMMGELGIETDSIPFDKSTPALLPTMREYLKDGPQKVGLFAFNAFCGLKLCCALDSMGLMEVFASRGLVVCDNSPLLYSFSPRPAMIDLNLPAMAEFALDALCRRLERPELPETILLQAPKMVTFPPR